MRGGVAGFEELTVKRDSLSAFQLDCMITGRSYYDPSYLSQLTPEGETVRGIFFLSANPPHTTQTQTQTVVRD